jgi:hypothetical protein
MATNGDHGGSVGRDPSRHTRIRVTVTAAVERDDLGGPDVAALEFASSGGADVAVTRAEIAGAVAAAVAAVGADLVRSVRIAEAETRPARRALEVVR